LTYVFQDFALLPWRTVAGNVAFALEHHEMTESERAERVADVLVRTRLSEFADACPKQLSGGMRQRVGIARALAVNPAILLMDEPLSALDSQTRELLMEDFLAMWRNNNLGALYVTHNLPEALYLADRVVVLSRRPGRVIENKAIPIPQHERKSPCAQAELQVIQNHLWSLIRDHAASADRELLHV
jgi:NitT/TauT family transport system ATP-binding protein